MTDVGDVLLFFHIIGTAGWIGGATFAYFYLGQLAKEGGAERGGNMESYMERLRQYGAVAIPLVLLTGVGLVLTEDQWSWGDTFVWVGIGAIVVSGIWEGAYARKKDEALVESVKAKRTTVQHGSIAGTRPSGSKWRSSSLPSGQWSPSLISESHHHQPP